MGNIKNRRRIRKKPAYLFCSDCVEVIYGLVRDCEKEMKANSEFIKNNRPFGVAEGVTR